MSPFASKAERFVVTRTSVERAQHERDESVVRRETFVFDASVSLAEVFEKVVPLSDSGTGFGGVQTRTCSQYSINIEPDENSIDIVAADAEANEARLSRFSRRLSLDGMVDKKSKELDVTANTEIPF